MFSRFHHSTLFYFFSQFIYAIALLRQPSTYLYILYIICAYLSPSKPFLSTRFLSHLSISLFTYTFLFSMPTPIPFSLFLPQTLSMPSTPPMLLPKSSSFVVRSFVRSSSSSSSAMHLAPIAKFHLLNPRPVQIIGLTLAVSHQHSKSHALCKLTFHQFLYLHNFIYLYSYLYIGLHVYNRAPYRFYFLRVRRAAFIALDFLSQHSRHTELVAIHCTQSSFYYARLSIQDKSSTFFFSFSSLALPSFTSSLINYALSFSLFLSYFAGTEAIDGDRQRVQCLFYTT